jgi:hypothetical protein
MSLLKKDTHQVAQIPEPSFLNPLLGCCDHPFHYYQP